MPGFPEDMEFKFCPDNFGSWICNMVENVGFHDVSVEYMNAEHLNFGQLESQLPHTVMRLLLYLINEYMPTGILKIKEIERAEDVLGEVRNELVANRPIDPDLSNRFYESIPQNGTRNRLEIIDSARMYRNKVEVLIRLRSALESLYAGIQSPMNPIDYFCRYWLRAQLQEINHDNEVFRALNQCTTETQHPNDRIFTLTNVFKVCSGSDFEFRGEMDNQRLLYHFTFPSNILGILREGLIVAPSHIYSQNRFLGRGIYFWDCASMALNGFHDIRNTPVLLVCRVARGKAQEVDHMYLNQDEVLQFEPDRNSFFSRGLNFSATADETIEVDGVEMFCGQVRNVFGSKRFDDYNKYMVQQSNQTKVEYLLLLKEDEG